MRRHVGLYTVPRSLLRNLFPKLALGFIPVIYFFLLLSITGGDKNYPSFLLVMINSIEVPTTPILSIFSRNFLLKRDVFTVAFFESKGRHAGKILTFDLAVFMLSRVSNTN